MTGFKMMNGFVQVNFPRRSDGRIIFPADQRSPSAREFQQLDMSAQPEDWRPGHRDRPLSFRWKADYETLLRILDLPACRSRRGERVMASIVYDAALSAREDPTRRISYSRRMAFYSAAGRYDGTDYRYATVVPAVDALVAAGLLVDHDRVKGGPVGTGTQSSFRPAPDLADMVLPKVDYRVGELVRLRDDRGALVTYRDSEPIVRNRRFLEAVNRRIADADIRLHGINGAVIDDDAGTIFFPGFFQWLDDGYGDHTVYTRMKELYRVYNGSWALGGRIYGGWWQQVRKGDRRHLTIDGGATVELDYEMLHPRLLYAASGQKLDGDAYTLDGWDRTACKRAFNILLNARTYQSALGAILPHVGDDKRKAAALIAEMKRRHAAVAASFHSNAGLRLQNIDADMAKLVLRDLTLRKGITVLPVHDSFVVRREHHAALEEAMDRAFSQVTGSIPKTFSVSRSWGRTIPHRGEAGRGRGAYAVGAPREGASPVSRGDGCREPASRPAAQGEPADDPGPTAPPVSAARPVENRHDTSKEGTMASATVTVSEAPGTAGRAMRADAAMADPEQWDVPTVRPQKAKPSAIGASPCQASPRDPKKVVHPPAFLNPANSGRVAIERLHRMVDRPLADRRTLALVSAGKRRRG